MHTHTAGPGMSTEKQFHFGCVYIIDRVYIVDQGRLDLTENGSRFLVKSNEAKLFIQIFEEDFSFEC